MDSLLKHMVEMTGYRDHAMLDRSFISVVQEFTGALQTRLFNIVNVGGQAILRPRATIQRGTQPFQEDASDISADEPLSCHPMLVDCLARRLDDAAAIDADGTCRLWMPIWTADKAVVCLAIHHDTPLAGDMLSIVGGIMGVYRNFQNLLDYSERDSLTGLLNRKTFDDQLARMMHGAHEHDVRARGLPERRHAREQDRQWLAVVDVDHFKAVNDRFGHLYGDEVLILIANLLQSSFRAHDRVFRFGGEEFVILLRSTTLDNTWKIIERFRANVERHAFPQLGTVTVSVGFVSISTYESPVVTLGHADQALYHAKSSGRNLACHYDDLVSHGVLQTVASNDTAEFF